MGGYVCDKKGAEPWSPSLTGFYVMRVLNVLEVDEWEKVPGTHCRVETEGWGGGIVRLGHWCKDQWFNPGEELAEELRARSLHAYEERQAAETVNVP